MEITRESFFAGCRVLIDNGIDVDEAEIVLQALCYVMFDTETEQFMIAGDNHIPCCQNCRNFHTTCDKTTYHQCTIHDLANWVYDDKGSL